MEELTTLWGQISPYVMTAISVISYIGIALGLLASIKKLLSKNDLKANEDNIANKVIDKISNVSISQDIQPLVESNLEKVEEKALAKVQDKLDEQNKQYASLLSVVEGLASYFDNSIGVPAEAKAKLKKTIADAKNGVKTEVKAVSNVVIEEVKEKVEEVKNKVETIENKITTER